MISSYSEIRARLRKCLITLTNLRTIITLKSKTYILNKLEPLRIFELAYHRVIHTWQCLIFILRLIGGTSRSAVSVLLAVTPAD